MWTHVVADVGRRGDADRDVVGVAAGLLGGAAHRLDRPRGDLRVGELEDEPVADLAGQRQRLRPVAGDPHLELGCVPAHGNVIVEPL